MSNREIVTELDAQVPEGWVVPTWRKNMALMTEELFLSDGSFRPDFIQITSNYCGTGAVGSEEWRPHVEKRMLKSPFPTADALTICQSSAFAELGEKIGLDYETIESMLVWGGGFGCQPAILKRLAPQATIIAVDLPICLLVQWEYCKQQQLRTNLALEGYIEKGVINFIPVSLCGLLPKVDFFVATHSLSECPVVLQNLVSELDWFGARYLMLAHGHNAAFSEEVFNNFDQLFQAFLGKYPSVFCESDGWVNPDEKMFDRGRIR